MAVGSDDYDSPWKDALETFLPDCLELFFPASYAAIDWTKPYTFLDQEFRQIERDAERGRQVVDKLVQVSRLDGAEAWVLVHIEVQSQPDPDFAKRIDGAPERVGAASQSIVPEIRQLTDPQVIRAVYV